MTEAEWLSCGGPGEMLAYLGESASARKLRLFASACCRDMWSQWRSPPYNHPDSARLLDISDLFAEGATSPDALASAVARATATRGTLRARHNPHYAAGPPDTLLRLHAGLDVSRIYREAAEDSGRGYAYARWHQDEGRGSSEGLEQ
jgi:hypothetical protein